jgi:hypothetical protein
MASFLSALFLFSLSRHCFVPCLAKNKHNITTDELALLAFKSLTLDPHDMLANNWSTSFSVCTWVGVTCDEKHNRVHTLNLTNMGLRGIVSPNLGNMSFLVILDIFYNIRKLDVIEITQIPLLQKLPLGKSKGICGHKKL